MNDALRDNLNSGNEDPNGLGYTEYCAVCQTRLSPKTMFCPVCDPPSPPDIEPEEQGISFDQALLRIGALLILFLAVAFVKLEFSLDTLFTEQKVGEEIETLTEKERPHDKDFQTVHTVITSLANIRSKPSMDGALTLLKIMGTGQKYACLVRRDGYPIK